ncbi:MAG TPA: NUDIX domain-containing protein [Candidatus Limnocylindrales bacterium]|jgi:predicted NUDIX family NTP pyrophosphohydrolase
MVVRQSAGLLLFRRRAADDGDPVEVLLAHPGGPFFARRDEGHWSIPKGEPDAAEADLLEVARREFAEEVGSEPPAGGPNGEPPISLGTIVQKGGKIVHAWAVEGDLDAAAAQSNTFEMEWPPRSGRRQTFPEIDRVGWFGPDEARRRLKPTQVPFVDRLVEALRDGRWPADVGMAAAEIGSRVSETATKPDGA